MRKTHFAMENKLCRTEELSKSLPIILGMVWKKEVERVILGHGPMVFHEIVDSFF